MRGSIGLALSLLALDGLGAKAPPPELPFALGVEYAEQGLGPAHGHAGVTWAKTRLEAFAWGRLEPAAPTGGRHTYDFTCTDAMLREYQQAGMVDIVSYLDPTSSWGSVSPRDDVMPKPEYLDDFGVFVSALVERYDGDGTGDMPGLLAGVRIWVVGGEWTGYFPTGNADDYIRLLEVASAAIRAADPNAGVGLIPFMLVDVFEGNVPTAQQIEARLKDPPPPVTGRKSTAGILKMLGRPELFDYVDVHALGDYTELPPLIAWFRARMAERGYQKPVLIDDAYPSSYLANGARWPAIYPVTPAIYDQLLRVLYDVSDYREPAYSPAVAWARREVASSLVKKAVVAAAEGYAGIQIGNTEDWMWDEGLDGRDTFVFLFGAVAMSGLVDARHPLGYDTCIPRIAGVPRPGWQSLRLVASQLEGFERIEKVTGLPEGVWAYRIHKGARTTTAVWYESRTLPLPGQTEPSVTVDLPAGGASTFNVTAAVPDSGSAEPAVSTRSAAGGALRLTVTRAPLFVESVDFSSEAVLRVPIVLSAPGQAGSFFSSELTLTNRGTSPGAIRLTYTPAFGSGGGSVVDSLEAGRQTVIPDAIAYLRSRGLSIPATGTQGGTLTAVFTGLSSPGVASASVRTTTPTADGRAGLAYAGEPDALGLHSPVYLWGLRQNTRDRANVALINAGSSPITLRLTAISANPDAPLFRVLPDVSLQPGELKQISGVLSTSGLTLSSGAIRVERLSGSAPFQAYAVLNDQVTSDGSYVPPWPWSGWTSRLVLPAVVETPAFVTEVTLGNPWSKPRAVRLTYVMEGATARIDLTLRALEQVIVPSFVQLLRDRGVPGVGPPGGTFAGALFVTSADGYPVDGFYAGGRTLTTGAAGRYGLAYTAVPEELAPRRSAWLYGLKQDAQNRTNLAVVNLGETEAAFHVELFDGATGARRGEVLSLTIGPLGWKQVGSVLSASALQNGYARVVRTSGSGRFVTYAVVNDGEKPGERSGDGAFLEMVPEE